MSMKFDALCYMRIFSDDGKKNYNRKHWTLVPIRGDQGFNYISLRKYCYSKDIGVTIEGMCRDYKDEIFEIFQERDEFQVYVWLRRGGRVEKLNSLEIGPKLMGFLSKFDASICFSVDPGFPDCPDN